MTGGISVDQRRLTTQVYHIGSQNTFELTHGEQAHFIISWSLHIHHTRTRAINSVKYRIEGKTGMWNVGDVQNVQFGLEWFSNQFHGVRLQYCEDNQKHSHQHIPDQ